MASLAEGILRNHMVEGEWGGELGIRIDQTLTQDATGTLAYLQFEAIGLPGVKTELSLSYVDHNTLQTGFENADDHAYLQTVASRYGIKFSRPGNGICHQVHLERFGAPGKTLLGSDSHTPTCGGLGMIAIGAGGLDVAAAMAGEPFYMKTPKIVGVRLIGRLNPGASAKDVILLLLKKLTVKGGVGKIIEYCGPGLATLSVPERATICNMGAELGATTSIFPSDEVTLQFLKLQKREASWKELNATDAAYDEMIEMDLSKVEPFAAAPHSPDNVIPVRELCGAAIDQVCIGSCTNSSLKDMATVAAVLRGRKVHPDVSLTISPGSKQVFEALARSDALADMIASGARILESACGPCIGMGQAPKSGAVSLRTFNRNFEGRSGTKDARVYLVSPETAAASALEGVFTVPKEVRPTLPELAIEDSGIIEPSFKGAVVRGPNIAPLPIGKPLARTIKGEVLIKTGDNITTDHIMPAGAKILPLRSNIPKISEFVFSQLDPSFAKRAREKGGFILGGENYGQGSSREHAAIAPMHLGVRAVIAKSFARIHRANLINFGIAPLEFEDPSDYDKLKQGDFLELDFGKKEITNKKIKLKYRLSEREETMLNEGGLLNFIRSKNTQLKNIKGKNA
jgi:aconitate hydratase